MMKWLIFLLPFIITSSFELRSKLTGKCGTIATPNNQVGRLIEMRNCTNRANSGIGMGSNTIQFEPILSWNWQL